MAVEHLSWNDPATQARWTALDKSSVFASPQTSSAYLSALSEATQRVLEVTFVTRNDSDVAGLAAAITHTGPLRRIVPAPLTSYSAIAATTFPSTAAVHAGSDGLDELFEALGRRYSTVDLMLSPSIRDVRVAQWQGWTASPLYTFTLSISDSQIDEWSDGTRRTFNKHSSAFELRSRRDDFKTIQQLWAKGYEKSDKQLPLEKSHLERMCSELLNDGLAECWSVSSKSGDRPEAGIILLKRGTTSVYWLAGSVPGPAMTVLIGLLSKVLAAEGITQMDFVGANTRSIAEFKRRFHSELDTYYRVRYTRSKLLRLVQSVIRSVR